MSGQSHTNLMRMPYEGAEPGQAFVGRAGALLDPGTNIEMIIVCHNDKDLRTIMSMFGCMKIDGDKFVDAALINSANLQLEDESL